MASQSIEKEVAMLSKRYAQPDRRRCVSCGACTKECPRDAIHIYRGCYAKVDELKCIGCKKCAKVCPADCIAILERLNREVSA